MERGSACNSHPANRPWISTADCIILAFPIKRSIRATIKQTFFFNDCEDTRSPRLPPAVSDEDPE
ncbi:hypothetical protein EYF80_048358 [Liparis tanakae]|uniref:Uncharacterized protein n=1 Tax=Liparis tanakae TaxID=230148 RepID=A0A4Z2FL26_9TELE|nr:hypothetical protein EYF80_048358 [Liparis tanakae]